MQEAYGVADDPNAGKYLGWWRYSTGPYPSGTHGGRYVMNWGNRAGADYINYEEAGVLPVGSAIAKDSFSVGANGKVTLGPLFLMEKMEPGFNEASGDWKYTMIMPDGSTFGATGGAGDASVEFCNECHAAVAEDQDYLFFLPEEYRASN
ncbi:MAG: cytochrome P460 family protein [Pseudomonadota bacterium]